MINLKHILNEIAEDEATRLLQKIKNKDYTFFNRGDNGKVYQLNGEKAKVVSTKEEQGLYTVYNITNVSGNHNYYTNEILVHNKGGN